MNSRRKISGEGCSCFHAFITKQTNAFLCSYLKSKILLLNTYLPGVFINLCISMPGFLNEFVPVPVPRSPYFTTVYLLRSADGFHDTYPQVLIQLYSSAWPPPLDKQWRLMKELHDRYDGLVFLDNIHSRLHFSINLHLSESSFAECYFFVKSYFK